MADSARVSSGLNSPRDLHWSPEEKAAARRAFELALNREKETTIQQAKDKAAKIEDADDLSMLERWLTHRRQEIDRTYDYRYSMLILVFAGLLRTRRLDENELEGLAPEKIEEIRFIAGM
jgi:hypothetical protein